MADELPKTIPMYLIPRGMEFLGIALDGDGNPVATTCCDCGSVTELVLADANTAPTGSQEVAFTCDGCMSSHWLTLTISPPADQLGLTEGTDRG